ncbi:MAG: hypothetical protein ABFC96_18380 [Thermoguttaceae bacterium]
MPFRYLKDPLFLACFGVYWVHRCMKCLDLSTLFLRSYLNDLICIPFWVPIILWAHRRLRLRRHDFPPEAIEIVIPLIAWSFLFEVLIPSRREWSIPAVADPGDVLCYCVGAAAAAIFWSIFYRSDLPKS